ncbi:MAG: phosphoribosylformylglycinamidine cyclo-ligase [Actinomycetota bacterium]
MKRQNGRATTYADSGVDIGAGRRAVELIRESVRSTLRPEVVGDIGGFGGAFAFDPRRFKEPLLVSGTDGAGTKVMVAQRAGIHTSIGIDLVAMSVNDVAAHGAEPLFFLDYIVTDRVDPKHIDEIVSGVAEGCRDAGCALLGGEIAEHPGHMHPDSYDLAGFCVGVVERSKLITGQRIAEGDAILGIESSGLHSNGYSMVRKVLLDDMGLDLDDRPMELGGTLGEELLKPTLIYSKVLLALADQNDVHGLAHITGGGLPENLGRIIPEGLQARIKSDSWTVPPIFRLIASLGQVDDDEMFATFNMGIGMVAVVPSSSANHALDVVRSGGHRAHEIGVVVSSKEPTVKFV